MEILRKKANIYLFKIITFLLILTIIILLFLYLYGKPDSKFTPLLGGMTTGLSVALLQLMLMWTEHKEMEKIKVLGIRQILPYRDDKDLYGQAINGANEEIRVLGSTLSRFLEDFANENRQDKKNLLDALNRNVKIKFLLPRPEHLWNPNDAPKAEQSLSRIRELKSKYGNLIECKCYNHKPFHNLVLADRSCFVGPIFPDRTSRDTPTIYTDKESVFAKRYLEYFDFEWEGALSCLTS